MTPGAFDFAQRSNPVLMMARGGALHFNAGGDGGGGDGGGGGWDFYDPAAQQLPPQPVPQQPQPVVPPPPQQNLNLQQQPYQVPQPQSAGDMPVIPTVPAAQQPAQPAQPQPTQPAQPTGFQAVDYQGNKFDAGSTLNLAKQVAQNFDFKSSSGGAFSTKGQGIGFEYDQAKQIMGKDPSAAEQVMLDVSRYLQQKGVKDLNQIGVREVDVEREYGDSGNTRTEKQKEFYNKDTGQRIAAEGESIGSTFTGKGGTYYNLTMDKDGKPTFTTKGADTSDAGMVAMLLPLVLGPAGLNLSGMLGGALQGAGLGSLASQAISQGLISGGTSALMGGDFLKGALSGAVGPIVGSGISGLIPTEFAAQNPQLAKLFTNIGTSAAMGALSGGKVGDALKSGLFSGIAGAALDKAGVPSNFAPALVSLVRRGKITPQAAVEMMARMGKKG